MRRWISKIAVAVGIMLMSYQTQAATTVVADSNALNLVGQLTQNAVGLTVLTPTSVTSANQSGLVNAPLALGVVNAAALTLPAPGIMLTTGNLTGTGGNLGLAGDADVENILLNTAGYNTTGTADAASIQFTFTVAPGTTAITFDFIFASNEAIGAVLPDTAVVMVDGVNKAVFNNGGLVANQTAGLLFAAAPLGTIVSGYNNVSQLHTITALLDPLLTTHTVKIAIADNTSVAGDSAIIASNLQLSASTQEGMGVGDIFAPVITPTADIVMEASAALTPVVLGVPTVTDNLDPNPTVTAAPLSPYPVGVTQVTWSATDAAGNIGTAVQTVTITDTTPPVITIAPTASFNTSSPTMSADIAAFLATVVATDQVGVVGAIANDAPVSFPIGATTVTFTASDAAGNVGTAATVINVAGTASVSEVNASTLVNRLTQNDANITTSLPVVASSANQTGLVNITNFGGLQVNPAPAAATPLLMPSTGIVLTTGNLSGTGGNIGLAGDADVFDALQAHPQFSTTGTFDAASLQFSFTVPAGTTAVSFDLIYATNEGVLLPQTFPDAAMVIVDGTNKAVFGDSTLLSNLNGAFLVVTPGDVVSGYTNVSQVQRLTALLNPLLTTHTVKIAIADNTNATVDSALIVANMLSSAGTQEGMGVGDVFPPVVTPPADIVMEATAFQSGVNLGTATVTDNVDLNLGATPTPAGPYPLGVTQVIWSATDAAGNIGTAIQTVTISDTTAPVLTLPAASTFAATSVAGLPASDSALAVLLGSATATDAVGIATVNNDAPANFPVGVTTVTYTARDTSGLTSSASVDITISAYVPPVGGGGVTGPGIDYIPPVMRLNGNDQIEVVQGAVYVDAGAIAKDNIDGFVTNAIDMSVNGIAVTPATAVNTAVIGSTVITYSVSDAAGNSSSIARRVNVVASALAMKPVITAPTEIIVAATDYRGAQASNSDIFTYLSEVPALPVLPGRLSATGQVGAITNTVVPANADPATIYLPVGKNVVVFSATNANGTATASSVITVTGTRTFEPQLLPSDDTDGDGISDTWEMREFGDLISTGGPKPRLADSDGDLIPDRWEAAIFDTLLTADIGTDYDQDGLLDSEERLIGTDPLVTDTNPASVGLKDSNDVVFPLEPSDTDGDGIFDVFEDASSVIDATVASGIPSAGRSTTFSIDANGNPLKHVAVNQLTYPAPSYLQGTFGELSFDVHTAVGATITVRITSSAPFGADAQFYKVTGPGNYSLIPASHYNVINGNTVDFTLTDGGPLDLDGVANGVIVDPVAVGAAPQILGGGSAAGGAGSFSWFALLLVSILMLPLRRRSKI